MEAENVVEEDLGEEDPKEISLTLSNPLFQMKTTTGTSKSRRGPICSLWTPARAGRWIDDDDPMIRVDVEEDGPRDSNMGETTSESEMKD